MGKKITQFAKNIWNLMVKFRHQIVMAVLFFVFITTLTDYLEDRAIENRSFSDIVQINSLEIEDITAGATAQAGVLDREVLADRDVTGTLTRELNPADATDNAGDYICAVELNIGYERDRERVPFTINYDENPCPVLDPGEYYWDFYYKTMRADGVQVIRRVRVYFNVAAPQDAVLQ